MTDLLHRGGGHQEDTIRIPALRAAIYVPTDLAERDLAIWRERCIAHCLQRGYDIVVVVTGGPAAWEQLHADLTAGDIQIVVVGRREHLPPQRLPRVEETGVEPATSYPQPRRGQQRPRRLRARPGEAGGRA